MWKNISIFLTTLCLISLNISSAQLQAQGFAKPKAHAYALPEVQASAQAQALAQSLAQASAQAQAQASAPSQAEVQAYTGVVNPVTNQDPTVNSLASCISNNLQNSKVLAPYNQFTVDKPSDLIFRVATNFLTTAGICDPQLAQLDADAANKARPLTSKLYFDATGFTMANFFASHGLVTPTNVDSICLKFVHFIELDACASGPTDTLTMMNSVTSGIFNVFGEYGLTDYQSMKTLFNIFSIEITSF